MSKYSVENDKSSCGVGFQVSLKNESSNDILKSTLHALKCVEHRGGTNQIQKNIIGDGAGIITSIPYELLGRERGSFALAFLFTPQEPELHKNSLRVFEQTFSSFDLEVEEYREVPIDTSSLQKTVISNLPKLKQAIIKRPKHCRTLASFEKLLYSAKQMTRTTQKRAGIHHQFYFASLSSYNVIYKALCTGEDLEKFYLDLQSPKFKTNFGIFHRRFSTNTTSTWDKVQPFRMVAHNGEINTIEGNKAWGIIREKALGLRQDELITHYNTSDSGSLNCIVEALKHRSSVPKISEIFSILMPPANLKSSYYNFWSRSMEPWDGPALVVYTDGKSLGARLDRNGLRPCRWTLTQDMFYLCSEAGTFDIANENILKNGSLGSGSSVNINAFNGEIDFEDPEAHPDYKEAFYDSQFISMKYKHPTSDYVSNLNKTHLFHYSKEDIDSFIKYVIINKKEPIGSMGDTARLAFLSDKPRSFFDFFFQTFAQVTNPPFDYIREKDIVDMRVYLGRKPNIFEPKELIPPKPILMNEGAVISLGQMQELKENDPNRPAIKTITLSTVFEKNSNLEQVKEKLQLLEEQSIQAVKDGHSIIVLSDKEADQNNIPIPSIFALRKVVQGLNKSGRRLRTSVIVESGDVKNSHHLACLLSFGASAVCPYLILERAYFSEDDSLKHYFPKDKEKRLIKVLNSGIVRIMAKMGISVLRSYQGSGLFSTIGFNQDVLNYFFPNKVSSIGGMDFTRLLEKVKRDFAYSEDNPEIKKSFIFKEHPTGKFGEMHSLTSSRSRMIHKLIESKDEQERMKLFSDYSKQVDDSNCFIRHLISIKNFSKSQTSPDIKNILSRFGSGGMSFGAISAESQKDIIEAFREIGGRSNSGEGGENPYYEKEDIVANIKQLASGRFGVTCEYLINGQEVQIKIAQGAKPGEGGQLMGPKVTAEIAKARFATAGVDLISPPPQHDIYSIEDLKELIYEIKQLKPELKVSVKLVSGKNIGAIAVGVVKAGADIIQISGGDGGTGAASLLSMKHAGLPLEIGLIEVHHSLVQANLRNKVYLRADGGLLTGKDIVIMAILGADQFDFGKILLVSQGCIMARICEKNTCPTGIATHDPKFKEKYKGNVEKIVTFLNTLAIDVAAELKQIGAKNLSQVQGSTTLLKANESKKSLIKQSGFDLDYFYEHQANVKYTHVENTEAVNELNQIILKAISKKDILEFSIKNTDRAIPATLNSYWVQAKDKKNKIFLKEDGIAPLLKELDHLSLTFNGSAGHGFGLFVPKGISLRLNGVGNDFVGKGLCGGHILVTPPKNSKLEPSESTIIGNCVLYGATSGTLFVNGRAGDRFAVRNSGAISVVEGVGIHACEYMTGGKVLILGESDGNIGAGMTGGTLFLVNSEKKKINNEYISHVPMLEEDIKFIKSTLKDYIEATNSKKALAILNDFKKNEFPLIKYIPKNLM